MDPTYSSVKTRVKKRFSSTRYIFSKAGVPKILSIILFLVAGILYLTGNGSPCSAVASNPSHLPDLVFPLLVVVSAALSAVGYAIFATGCAKKALPVWVRVDITVCTLLAIGNLIVSILVLTLCPPINTVQGVPAPLSLVASALLVICAAATYYMWRHRPEEPDNLGRPGPSLSTWRIPGVARGSIFSLEVERNAFEL